jgi:hypothetical protein
MSINLAVMSHPLKLFCLYYFQRCDFVVIACHSNYIMFNIYRHNFKN